MLIEKIACYLQDERCRIFQRVLRSKHPSCNNRSLRLDKKCTVHTEIDKNKSLKNVVKCGTLFSEEVFYP
jgi:hypothetical protein